MAMRQARRIAQDIAEANTLPNIRVSCMHERMTSSLPTSGSKIRVAALCCACRC